MDKPNDKEKMYMYFTCIACYCVTFTYKFNNFYGHNFWTACPIWKIFSTSCSVKFLSLRSFFYYKLTGRSVYAPEKETDECPKTELTGEICCYKRENTLMKRAPEEWKNDIVYDP